MILLQSMPEFVVPTIVGGAFFTVAGVASWGIHTIRKIDGEVVPRIEAKLDRVLSVMYGAPESKEADGLVKDVREVQAQVGNHWSIIKAQNQTLNEMDGRITGVERTCRATHRGTP